MRNNNSKEQANLGFAIFARPLLFCNYFRCRLKPLPCTVKEKKIAKKEKQREKNVITVIVSRRCSSFQYLVESLTTHIIKYLHTMTINFLICIRNQGLFPTLKKTRVQYSKPPKKVHLINIFTGSQSWNIQHHGQTIHPTEKLISMNLFKFFVL